MIGDQINTGGSRIGAKLLESDPVSEKRYFVADTPEERNSGFKCNAIKLLESTKNVL